MIAFNRLQILIVEDHFYMRKILRTLLSGLGCHTVYEAENGAQGLKAVDAYSPDVVITDWEMPEIDGPEMVRLIRDPNKGAIALVPIIMLTGHTQMKQVETARDVGVNEFICKPTSARILYDRIQSVILKPRQFIRTNTYFGPDRRRHTNSMYAGPERRGQGMADLIEAAPMRDLVDFE